MAQYSSKDVGFVLIDGYSVLGTLTTLQDNVEAILQETTVLGAGWATYASVAVKKGSLSQGGFFDDAAGSINAALMGNEGVSRVFVYTLETNIIGARFIGFGGAMLSKYERGVALQKLHVATAAYSPSGAVEQGQILHALGAEAGAGNTNATSVDNAVDVHATVTPITSNSVDAASVVTTPVPHGLVSTDVILIVGVVGSTPAINGEQVITYISPTSFSVPVNVTVGGTGGTFTKAKTTNGGSAYLACSALTLGGYTNFVVKVQHSVDAAVWVDLAAFTVLTAIGAERKVVAAGTTVNRYLSAIWSYGGAGAGNSATFMVGFSRA